MSLDPVIDVERATLGAILLTNALPAAVFEAGLAPEHFHRDEHRLVFSAMLELAARGESIDPVTVSGRLNGLGERAAIDALTADPPNLTAAGDYARIVCANAHRRAEDRAAAAWREQPDDLDRRRALRDLLDASSGPITTTAWDLDGSPMDPAAHAAEALPALPGFPFLHAGAGAVIVGPTGGGRSSLVQACAYDAAQTGLRIAYLGSEVTEPEFNARAADLASRRSDPITGELRTALAHVRYLNLASVTAQAWANPDEWTRAATERFDVVIIDPLSAVASALNLDFDKSNAEFVRYYDRLVQPLATAGVAVLLLDNVGHALEARSRAKGASAKSDRADLTFSCKLRAHPTGLIITAHKVRSVRAAFARGDSWTFDRDTQRITRGGDTEPDEPAFRPTVLMQRVSQALETNPGLSKRGIRTAVTGKAAAVDLALEFLITDGHVRIETDGHATRHHVDHPYRETDEPHRVPPCPDRVPDTVGRTVSPCPHLRSSGDTVDAGSDPPHRGGTVSPDSGGDR